MAQHSQTSVARPPAYRSSGRPAVPRQTPVRRSWARVPVAVLAFMASIAFAMVNVVDPSSGAVASPYYQAPARFNGDAAQRLVVADAAERTVQRDSFGAEAKPKPTPTPTPTPAAIPAQAQPAPGGVEEESGSSAQAAAPVARAAAPDPGSAKAIAYDMIVQRGWADSEYDCLVLLWNRESGWNVYAENKSSGAYGIPQALPGSKMATSGSDWATNASTQIVWGIDYISGRYGSPCGAWGHSQSLGWY
ncbi:lytic transglycosylase domain-containing protein [Rathayibacter tritici]|uniref:aggregation-promoting factor C-terminal-like domain-containing protein n=3 Tax=Rathayibacter tritici TaxID=33888 RepID=UPI0020113065|nr:lytic transglycosylase domain-containing protein [Rathayibacter tritici]